MKKIIHYFYDDTDIYKKGRDATFRMCYTSWKLVCPDYEIMCWHDNMPEFQQMLKDSRFLRECYKRKMWAFVADYVRHYALYNYGGIYLDTDVQVLKNFDDFLDKPFFCSIEGDILHGKNIPESAVMGGEKGHIIFKTSLDFYNSDEIFKYNYFIDPVILAKHLEDISGFTKIEYDEQVKNHVAKFYNRNIESIEIDDYNAYCNQKIYNDSTNGIFIYPSEYFCPTWNVFKERSVTDKTVCIHWNQSSWWVDCKNKNIIYIQSLRYKNSTKRFLYVNKEKIAKYLTLCIPLSNTRRHLRQTIENKIQNLSY